MPTTPLYADNFIKSEGGSITGDAIHRKYRQSPIPSRGLGILLLSHFLCQKQKNFQKIRLYDYEYTGIVKNEDSNNEEKAVIAV